MQIFAQSSAQKFDNIRVVGIANILDSLYTVNLKVDGTATLDAVTSAGNISGATYGSDGSISDAELLTWDDGAVTQIIVGGGAGSAPVWGADLPTAVTIGTAYIYRANGTDVSDGDVADDITLTNITQVTTRPITSLTATNWRMFYSAAGAVPVELALGADGTFLQSSGASTLPEFTALVAGDIPDISATYEVQLNNEAGLYAVLSDVTNFLQSGDIDGTGELAAITDYETGSGALVFGTSPTITTKLTVDGNKSAANIAEFINDDNGAVGDSSVVITPTGGLTATGNIAGATYGSDASVSDAELLYVDATSSIQTQLDARCLESVFGISVGTGLTLDGTALKTHAALQSIAGLTEADVSIIEATADNAYSVVTSGGNNYILGSNVDNTALEFKTPANVLSQISAQASDAELSAIAGLTFADVSIIEGTGAAAAAIVTSGGNNYILGSNSGNTALEFKAPTGSGTPVLATSPTFTGLVKRSVTATITAVNPGGQGDGALITDINEVSVVGAENDAVTLPAAVAGLEIFIINNGANILEIWPATDDDLGAGANTATTLAAGANVTFINYNSVNWEIK